MIKSQILKNIIYGLIFSIIFGIISNLLYSKLKLEESVIWYKQLYVLDIDTTKSDKMSGIRNAGIVNYTKFISDQFFSSLKFSLFIFKKTNKLKVCEHIRIEEADLSIFIESKGYESLESQNLDHKSQQLF